MLRRNRPRRPPPGDRSLHDDLRATDRGYALDDIAELGTERGLPSPGDFPYTRGIHPTGYRGRLWTMRQFAGFGTPEETNERFKGLLKAGGGGLSVAFDLPTLMGRDPDHELSLGEVGKCGVSVVTLADMERLFDGISLAGITTSMTINSPAPMIFAMYLAVAEQQGADWKTLSGTIQNDILKEFIAQKEYIFPPRQSMRLITDIFAFCSTEVPKWNTISVSGYHIREAGSTSARTGLHAPRRHRNACSTDRRGARRGRLRAPDFLFLQFAQRFLRGDREVPCRAQNLGGSDAGSLQGEERALVEAALPHPDRGRVPDRAAAL